MVASFKQPKKDPVDYYVPDFGVDTDIITSLYNTDLSEKERKHTWRVPTKKEIKDAQHPVDYFVPNFGQDAEIKTSLAHTALAEKELKHTWVPPTKKELKDADYPKDYVVPNFGVDSDIVDTQKHIAAQETRLNHKWNPVQDENGVWGVPGPDVNRPYTKAFVQTDAKVESDPICSSAGCNYASEKGPKTHPMNYFVPNFGADHGITQTHESLDWAENSLRHRWIYTKPEKKKDDKDYKVPNFGVDEDILWTQKNIKDASKNLKHDWKPEQDENGVWLVPSAADNNSYSYKSLVQLDSEIKSDPICSSAGCNYASEKGPKTHPMNYFVPNFGKDKNVKETWSSLDWAERHRNHRWILAPDWDKKKDEFEDFRVPDFGLDEDVVDTQSNLKLSEKNLKHTWNPKQDENGVWLVPKAHDNRSYSYREEEENFAQIPEDEAKVQLEKKHKKSRKSDPICSSAGWPCDNNKHKSTEIEDLRRPDFGVDSDIINTQKHVRDQETRLKHKWTPKVDENGVWKVPSAAQKPHHKSHTLTQLSSDPICNSVGCPKSKWYDLEGDKEAKYALDPVGMYGYDRDILDSIANQVQVEKALKHRFSLPNYGNVQLKSESDPICNSSGCTQWMWGDKLKSKDDKHVDYDFAPKLEGDVLNTWENLDVAEKIKSHEWKFDPKVYAEKDDDKHVLYNDAPKLDDDVIDTQDHIIQQEKRQNHKLEVLKKK